MIAFGSTFKMPIFDIMFCTHGVLHHKPYFRYDCPPVPVHEYFSRIVIASARHIKQIGHVEFNIVSSSYYIAFSSSKNSKNKIIK
jgi:hypothetical protein